jgi:hypothetical protein
MFRRRNGSCCCKPAASLACLTTIGTHPHVHGNAAHAGRSEQLQGLEKPRHSCIPEHAVRVDLRRQSGKGLNNGFWRASRRLGMVATAPRTASSGSITYTSAPDSAPVDAWRHCSCVARCWPGGNDLLPRNGCNGSGGLAVACNVAVQATPSARAAASSLAALTPTASFSQQTARAQA